MKNFKIKNIHYKKVFLWFLIISGTTLYSCKNTNEREVDVDTEQTEVDTIADRQVEVRAFTGEIKPINNTNDSNVSGEIAMRVEGDLMRFHVTAEGLAPDMMHLQYLITSQTGDETQCPQTVEETALTANQNNRGTEQKIRRIPLHMGPSSLELDVDTYPRTNENGELQFTRTVSLDSLRTAVRTEYGIQDLDFTKFTFVIRGLPDTAPDLPGRPDSLQKVSVGCAKLQETAVTD